MLHAYPTVTVGCLRISCYHTVLKNCGYSVSTTMCSAHSTTYLYSEGEVGTVNCRNSVLFREFDVVVWYEKQKKERTWLPHLVMSKWQVFHGQTLWKNRNLLLSWKILGDHLGRMQLPTVTAGHELCYKWHFWIESSAVLFLLIDRWFPLGLNWTLPALLWPLGRFMKSCMASWARTIFVRGIFPL